MCTIFLYMYFVVMKYESPNSFSVAYLLRTQNADNSPYDMADRAVGTTSIRYARRYAMQRMRIAAINTVYNGIKVAQYSFWLLWWAPNVSALKNRTVWDHISDSVLRKHRICDVC